jgi:hypothetical protein
MQLDRLLTSGDGGEVYTGGIVVGMQGKLVELLAWCLILLSHLSLGYFLS